MKAVVHIGTEKTGTTTIQRFLSLNRDRLLNQRVAYLKSPGSENQRNFVSYSMRSDRVDEHIKRLGIIEKEKRDAWRQEFSTALADEVLSISEVADTVIISSEHFHSRLHSTKEVENLRDLLSLYFSEVSILVYLRRQDELAVSLYSTKLKTGSSPNHILDPSISPSNNYFNFYKLVRRWSDIFGKDNLMIREFSKDNLLRQDLLADFMHQSGIDFDSSFFIPERENEKLPGAVQKLLQQFNKKFPSFSGNTENLQHKDLRTFLIKRLSKKISGDTILPSRDEAVAFMDQFAESNESLAREYLGGKALFSNDFSRYPAITSASEITEDLLEDLFESLSAYFSSRFVSSFDLASVDVHGDAADILRDLSGMYVKEYPEVALFLLEEARKYRPNGKHILNRIEGLRSRLKYSLTS